MANSSGAEPLRLLVISTVETAYNGLTMFILKYLRAMDLSGMAVGFVATGEPSGDLRRKLEALGIRLYILRGRNRNPLAYAARLARLIRRERYTVVHAHGNSSTLSVEMLAALLGGASVRIAHNHSTQCRYQALDRLLRPVFLRMANARMACSEEAGRRMFGRRPFEVIPVAADPRQFQFDESRRQSARKAMSIRDDDVLIGSVAMFAPVKNHAFLVEAFAAARARNGRLKLVLIGDGALRPQIEAAIERLGLSGTVCMTGSVPDIPERMQAMDMLVLPSLNEGFPNVLVEAQLAGLPVLVSDHVTRDCDITGLLTYLPLEAEAWAAAMAGAGFTDRESDSALGCRSAADSGYDLRVEATRLRARYETLLRQHANRRR